ncbi:MAG: hypothetical protein ACU841_09930 [Gammaproteobacteria bacterium]
MKLNLNKQFAWLSADWILAPGLTLAAELIAITPLCGFLFACGCTWPGLGLDSACNIRDHQASHQCPWCVSPAAGWLSLGFSVGAGVYASSFSFFRLEWNRSYKLIIQISLGVLIFIVSATGAAVISASVQEYPVIRGESIK